MDRRTTRPGEEARIPLERAIALRFKHFDDFIDELSANVSTGGMFIRTRHPHPIGSVFEFELRLGEELPLIAGKAQVAWVRRRKGEADESLGMGVRFVELEDESRRHIARLVAAYEAKGGRPFELEPATETPQGHTGAPETAEPDTLAAATTKSATPSHSPRATAQRAPAATAPRPAVPALPEKGDRGPARVPWVLLTTVLAVALAATLWLRPALETTPAAARPPVESRPIDGPGEPGDPVAGHAITEPEQIRLVNDWADSWSAQRVDDHLDAYSPRFTPPGGLDRAVWESQRRARILAPQWIEVDLAFVEIEETGPGRSRVRFVQAYESDSYGDVVRKLLDLELDESGWKILLETVEP